MNLKLVAAAAVAGFVVALVSSYASAQVVYLPVQYQYGADDKYYYGGSDPAIFHFAERESALRARNEVENEPTRVYSDLLPFRNARVYGFTIDDARNDALAAAPRYFRKADLLAHAVRVDGTLYVPPAAPRPYHHYTGPTPAVSSAVNRSANKGVIIIIPKKPAKQEPLAKPAIFVAVER